MKTQGGGQFREQLIGGDFTVTIVYPELKEKFVKLFGDLQKACESAPVDTNYKWVNSDVLYTQTLAFFIWEHKGGGVVTTITLGVEWFQNTCSSSGIIWMYNFDELLCSNSH